MEPGKNLSRPRRGHCCASSSRFQPFSTNPYIIATILLTLCEKLRWHFAHLISFLKLQQLKLLISPNSFARADVVTILGAILRAQPWNKPSSFPGLFALNFKTVGKNPGNENGLKPVSPWL